MAHLSRGTYQSPRNGDECTFYYALLPGGICVFSGAKNSSTVNDAGIIAQCIAKLEQRSAEKLVFWDLRTHLGYRAFDKGDWHLSRVFLNGPDMRWQRHGTQEMIGRIQNIFVQQIGFGSDGRMHLAVGK